MPNLGIGTWNVNAERIPNASVATKINNLRNMITLSFRMITADFYIFVIPEFYFMNADLSSGDMRWYTEDQRDEVLLGLSQLSRMKRRFLLVGGTICWYKTTGGPFSQRIWKIYNQAPVHYSGTLLKLHSKRLSGGEIMGHDALRVAKARGVEIDDRVTIKDRDQGDNPYLRTTRMTNLVRLSENTGRTFRDLSGNDTPSAPGAETAWQRYHHRLRYQPGTGEGSFAIPNTTFTGGVEVCMEHSSRVFASTSARGRTNFHIVTANTVSCHLAEIGMPDHTYITDPGVFIHMSAGADPKVVTRSGGTRTLVANWTDVDTGCKVVETPLPAGL